MSNQENRKGLVYKFDDNGAFVLDYNIKTIGSKEYAIRCVYVGDKDINNTLLRLAERKAIREMGLA